MAEEISQLHAVRHCYQSRGREVAVLHDVALNVSATDFVAIQGPSGGGKSTLLLIAGGLLRPTSGRVAVQGQDVYRLSPADRCELRAHRLGFVFQQFHLVPYLNVRENILAARLGITNGAGGDAAAEVDRLLAELRLTTRQDHKPGELSVGECQRVALARAMLNQPAMILADEPTGNLDDDNAAIVLSHLAEFAAKGGAVLLVTHSETAAAYASRRYHLRQGILELQ